jgi:uncharacterized protein (TIGR00730 family)
MNQSALDHEIERLVREFSSAHDLEYVNDLVRTSLLLGTDQTTTLDLKIASSALREMREAFQMFHPHAHRRKVTIFGSARTKPHDPLYNHTENIARELAQRGWMVVTGAGPGIMEAGMSGAGRNQSIGVSIRLPFESSANPIIAGDDKFVSMRYFFTRKLMLVKESHAFICMPGGFGTLDETFELLTLVQTGKSAPTPIVMLDLPGDDFWHSVDDVVQKQMLKRSLVSPEDLDLYRVCETIEDAVNEITLFYRNYHSIRFVGKHLVLRLQQSPTDSLVEQLNAEFGYLCKSGSFERISPTPSEISDNDHLDKFRIRFEFVRDDFGGLRRLINKLNQAATEPQ